MKLLVQKATTDVSVYLFVQNSSVTTGAGLTGLAYNSASLVAYYVRPLGSATAITLATQTVTGAHSDGGFVEVDATNMPGVYRLDLPDAVCATGVNSVVVMLKGATNMAPVTLEIQLSSFNPNDSVRLGLTALPNAAADAAGGLPISDAGGLDLDAQIGTKINDILTDTGTTLQAELDGIQADTEDIQTRLPAALTAGGNIKADVLAISGGSDAPTFLQAMVTDYDLGQLNASVNGFNTVQTYVDIGAYVWAAATRTLTALDEDSTTIDIDAAVRAAVGLASANLDTQLDALPTAAENAAALMDLSNGVETGVTPRQALRFIAAALAGELSGAATTTVTIKAANNNGTTRITATVDADGNRTALTLNGS